MAFLFILGQALPAHLAGACGARAVSRKTPIYFIIIMIIIKIIKIIIPRCNMTWRYLTTDGEDATPDVVAEVTSFFQFQNFLSKLI